MPLNDHNHGTNADGTPNEDYCIYCYKDGKFTQDLTMEQMIDYCARFTDEINKQSGQNLTGEQAKEMMRQFFPHLKRWKKWSFLCCCLSFCVEFCKFVCSKRLLARRSEFGADESAVGV